MARITRQQADAQAQTLNRLLGLPVDCYELAADGRYEAQVGCIHICAQNGTHTIYQLSNEAGACRGLAYGLSVREAYEWLSAAIEGVRLAQQYCQAGQG